MKNTISTYPLAESSTDDAAFYKECDVLVPAALEGAIHRDNCHKIQAKMIIEASNGPLTFTAEKYLTEKGVAIIPDVLTSAGGLVVSYFEWLKNLDHMIPGRLTKRWEERSKVNLLKLIEAKTTIKFDLTGRHAELMKGPTETDIVESALEDFTSGAVKNIKKKAKANKTSLRLAAYLDAIQKINAVYVEAGLTL